jgi:hypothetical protein
MIDYTLSDKLKIQYQTAKPFPYIVIDNFLPDFLLTSCLEKQIILPNTFYRYGRV